MQCFCVELCVPTPPPPMQIVQFIVKSTENAMGGSNMDDVPVTGGGCDPFTGGGGGGGTSSGQQPRRPAVRNETAWHGAWRIQE